MPKVQINGKTITLNKRDFLAQGGEGSVYAKGKQAFKIYTDRSKMIPAGKIRELSVLSSPNVIKPEEIIYSGKKAIGYTMRHIPKNVSLCQVFTKAFKDRNGVTPEMSFGMVQNMRDTVDHIHSNNILVVDLNEMNFLTSKDFKQVFFIDVDSYQTTTYSATAIMESIRDRHAKAGEFSTNTDWFSFAVVSFQVFTGIHPYKGKHSKLKGFDARMGGNVSVFNSSVAMPKCCLPFNVIPSNWRDWYKAVFEDGLRCAPPVEGGVVTDIVTIVSTVSGSDDFVIKDLFECDWDIIHYEPNFGNECVVCKNGFRIKDGKHIMHPTPCAVGYYGSTPFAARVENDTIKLYNITMQTNVTMNDIQATDLMSTGGRIYAKQADKILELEFVGPEYKPVIAAKLVGTVMEQATQIFPGVVIQNVLGSFIASVFPESGHCAQHKIEDLKGYQIVNAKYEGSVLIITAFKNGKYDRFVYAVDVKKISQPRISKDLQGYGVNFTVLDNGICISIIDTEEIEVFNQNNVHKIKIFQDNVIHGGMRLFHDGNSGMISNGKKMFSLKMK